MVFRDEVQISIKAGDGGTGRVSFLREKFMPKGGPDGGDGGKGGDVVITAESKLLSLESLLDHARFAAEDGHGGGGNKCSGRDGRDLELKVPVGTLIKDAERGHVLKDLDHAGASVVIAKGGQGGRGNARFASAVDRTPRRAEPGEAGESRRIKLELKLIADVGLVGFPNAGKSTLLGALSSARPKVGAYPFTTLHPNLGIVVHDYDAYVVADVPGLIEGAHEGKGLGVRFLRHVERTRVLLHLVDGSDEGAVADAWRTVRDEMTAYGAELAGKPEIVVVTKLDAVPDRAALERAVRTAGIDALFVSAVTGEGIPELIGAMVAAIERARAT